jgi:hypothetical protein
MSKHERKDHVVVLMSSNLSVRTFGPYTEEEAERKAKRLENRYPLNSAVVTQLRKGWPS